MKKFLNNAFVKVILVTTLATSIQAGLDVVSDKTKPVDSTVLGKAMAGGALTGLFYALQSPLREIAESSGVKTGAGAGGDDGTKKNP